MFLHNYYFFNGYFSFIFYCIIHNMSIIKNKHSVDEYFLIKVLSYLDVKIMLNISGRFLLIAKLYFSDLYNYYDQP